VVAPAIVAGDGVGRTFAVSVVVEPVPGVPGDRAVLERLAAEGLSIAPIPGSARVRVTLRRVAAGSEADAKNAAISRVTQMLPREGYVVSNPELTAVEERAPVAAGQIPA